MKWEKIIEQYKDEWVLINIEVGTLPIFFNLKKLPAMADDMLK
jgi:hypothetical protein